MNNCYIALKSSIQDDTVTYNDGLIKLFIKHGITKVESYSQFSNINSQVACIGFSEKERKWYGWSHRAFYGFGIGHIVKQGNCEASSGWTDEYLKEHPEEDMSMPIGFEVKNMEDARRCAIAFAESVS